MWTFLSLNNEVNNCALSLFFAIINTPDVSLSKRWTENGFVSWKISLLEKISTRFFFDLVPPWTDMPELLFKTIKFSLLSIIRFSFDFIISFVGWNLIFFWKLVSLNSMLNKSTLSLVLILCELLIFFLFNFTLPKRKYFSISPWGIFPNLNLIHRSIRISLHVESTM